MENIKVVDKGYHKYVRIGIFVFGVWFLSIFLLSRYIPGFAAPRSLGFDLTYIIPAVLCFVVGGMLFL